MPECATTNGGNDDGMNQYPVLNFIARYGMAIAVLGAALPVAAAVWYVAAGGFWSWLLAGAAGGCFGFLLIKSYVELTQLIIEMLLPK